MRTLWLTAAAVALSLAGPAAAQVFAPIPVTGYTKDVITNAVPPNAPPYVTTTNGFDDVVTDSVNHPGGVLYQQGYNPSFPTRGVPFDGSIVTSPTRSYQLGPISGSNSLQLYNYGPGLTNLTGTLSLATPARYAALSVLLASGVGRQPSEGGSPGTLAVNWSNGNATTYPYIVYDWFLLSGTPGPNSGVAISGLDRTRRELASFTGSTTDPRLFYYDFDLSADPNYLVGALVNSVTATGTQPTGSSEVTNIMGLSGAVTVPEPSALALVVVTAGFVVWRRAKSTRHIGPIS